MVTPRKSYRRDSYLHSFSLSLSFSNSFHISPLRLLSYHLSFSSCFLHFSTFELSDRWKQGRAFSFVASLLIKEEQRQRGNRGRREGKETFSWNYGFNRVAGCLFVNALGLIKIVSNMNLVAVSKRCLMMDAPLNLWRTILSYFENFEGKVLKFGSSLIQIRRV